MIKALILAGGPGGGLLPLTINTPKPLLPIGNYPLLLFQIAQLKKAGVQEIILSLSYQPRRIHQVFGDGTNFGIVLRYHVESSPLGTAGAFKAARHLLDDTALVINGDILVDTSIADLLGAHRRRQATATIATCRVPNPRPYGTVEVDREQAVKRFTERPRGRQVRTNSINAGIYVLEPSILELIPDQMPFFFENDLFPLLLERRLPFYGEPIQGYWTEITRTHNYWQANMDFLDELFPRPCFAAFPKEHHPPAGEAKVQIDAVSFIDENCQIKSGARIEHSVVGHNCRVEEGAILRNAVLWPGCRIQRGAVVSGSVLGRGCLVGEGARIHSGNVFGDKSVIAPYSRIRSRPSARALPR